MNLLKLWRRSSVNAHAAVDPNDGVITHDGTAWHSHLATVDREANVEGIGCVSRCCPTLFQAIDREWKMFPLGFLFGLGFETSSEVALLILTATSGGSNGDSETFVAHFFRSMLLPLLFAAGMSLLDSLDGMMMLWIYGWSMIDPLKKLFFNIFLTLTSAIIALAVAAVEVLAYIQDGFGLNGLFWDQVAYISDNFEMVGVGVVALFALSFLFAAISFRCIFSKLPGSAAEGNVNGRNMDHPPFGGLKRQVNERVGEGTPLLSAL